LKRAALPDKLDLLFALASPDLQGPYGDLKKGVRSLLDVRNRLAHFKERDTSITGAVPSIEDAFRHMADAEDPPLIRSLKRPEVLKHADTVANVSLWLRRLEKAHAKRRGTKVTTKKAPRGLIKRSSGRASRAADH
jgi:hypothetical protein